MRLRIALLAFVLLHPLLRAQEPPASPEPPLVAVPPAILLKVTAHGETAEKPTGAPLAELVQLALQSEPETAWRFVERDALDVISREHQLSLSGATDAASAIRTGRLSRADWILRVRLRADDLQRPRLEAEVIDALRADTLARSETPLSEMPNESWLLQPSEHALRIATTTAARALASAAARRAALAGRSVLAPLAFINRSGTDRLRPFAHLLQSALRAEHPGVRVLHYDSADGAIAESTLFQAGMTDLDPDAWSRVADAFAWGEYSEAPDFSGSAAATPVRLQIWLWRDSDGPRRFQFEGTLGMLDALARQAADTTLNASVGARAVATLDARSIAARQLASAAAELERKPNHAPGAPAESATAREQRENTRLRLLEIAAFFVPENLALREQHIALGLALAKDSAAHTRWTRAFWALFDQFLVGPDGRPDQTLLARAAAYQADVPGYGRRFARIGLLWQTAPGDDAVFRSLCSRFLYAVSISPYERDLPAAVEALWPTWRRINPNLDPASANVDLGALNTLSQIYRTDRARLRALLAGELVPVAPAPDPAPESAAPEATPVAPTKRPGPPSTPSTSHRPTANPSATWDAATVFNTWEHTTPLDELVERARTGPLSKLAALDAPVVDFSPQDIPGAQSGFPASSLGGDAITSVATDGVRLWLALKTDFADPANKRHSSAVIDLVRREIRWLPDTLPGVSRASAFWLEDRRVWVATRGDGLRLLDQAADRIETIDSTKGLPRDDIAFLLRGRDALFIGETTPSETVVQVDLATGAVSQSIAPAPEDLRALPAVARAAIASFGDTEPPRAKLPAEPAIGYDDTRHHQPPSSRSHDHRFFNLHAFHPEDDPAFARSYRVTGARDGFWLASNHSVFWAAGARRLPLAHWLQGRVLDLADDGTHLFVVILRVRADAYAARQISQQTLSPDQARIYVYHHREGRWLGWLPVTHLGPLQAAPGLLVIHTRLSRPLRLINTSRLAAPASDAVRPDLAAATRPLPTPTAVAAEIEVQGRLREAATAKPFDPAELQAALDAGADPCVTQSGSLSPIHSAALAENFAALELMLPRVRPDALNRPRPDRPKSEPLGILLLRATLEKKRPDLARRVLAAGAEPALGPWDESSFTPSLLWLAVLCGDADLARIFRDAGFAPSRFLGQHVLRESVAQKNAALLRVLVAPATDLARKIDIDDSSGDGRTALFAATQTGWTEGVRILLDAGARSFDGHHGTRQSLRDAAIPWPGITLLLNRRPGAADNRLAGAEAVAAVWKGDAAALAAVPVRPDVLRYRDFWDWTVLHHAARQGRLDLVRRLIAAGAPVNRLTTYGESPLCMAVFHGDAAGVDLLLAAGAAPNLYSKNGYAPLHAAADTGRADLARPLLRARADPDLRVGRYRDTAAMLAATTLRETETLRVLVEAGASLAGVDSEGYGVLESSVRSDSPDKIQWLIDRGVRWQKPVGPDYHPMDVAAREGLVGSIRKLQQLGLQSPRALSLAKDDVARAALQGDESEAGRRFRADEEQWPAILADPQRWRERALAHLAAGGDINHRSAAWGTPLKIAVLADAPERVAWLVGKGADPSARIKQVVGFDDHATVLHAWLDAQVYRHRKFGHLPAANDAVGLALLPIFWPHETRAAHREQLIESADQIGLLQTAAWMRAHQQTTP